MESQSVSSIFNPPANSADTRSSSTVDKEDFLHMLVAQLKYQNPLDPMNDQEFVAQMAQFSSLEQLQNMNATLAQNAEWNMLLSQTINNTMATSLIGKWVTAESTSITLQGDSVPQITFQSEGYAPQGMLIISNSAGDIVRTIPLSAVQPGINRISWNGKDSTGQDLPDGNYHLQIELSGADGTAVNAIGYVAGEVEGIKYINGQAYLQISGSFIPLSEVREVGSEGP